MWALPRCRGASPFQGPHQGAPYFRGRTWRRSCLEGGIWGHPARQTWEEEVGPCWKEKGLKEPHQVGDSGGRAAPGQKCGSEYSGGAILPE